MADFKTYDPAAIQISWKGIPVTGFAPDTFVMVERDEDSFSKEVGSDGDTVRVKSNNRGGKVTLTLMQSSPANDLFSQQVINDERFGGYSVGYFNLSDDNGTTLCEAENAWLMKPANVEFGNSAAQREWVIDCADLTMFIGGHLV